MSIAACDPKTELDTESPDTSQNSEGDQDNDDKGGSNKGGGDKSGGDKAGGDKGDGDKKGSDKGSDDKGKSTKDADASNLGEVDASEVIAIDAPKERVKRCRELGEKIYSKHGIKDDQEVVKCEEEGAEFEIPVFKVQEVCELLDGTEPWTCAMTYDQLAWCFEGPPECSMAKQVMCGIRLEIQCDPSVAAKNKPSDSTLRQTALHLSKLSAADFKKECKRRLKADQKDLGVKPGDEHECEASSNTVPVVDPEELCEELNEMLDFSQELCDLRMGDLLGCFSVESRCDPDRDHMCSMLVSGCAKE